MILEILSHLVSLDLDWFTHFVIANPFWVMIFASAAYFLSNKRALVGGALLALYIHATVDGAFVLGWTFGQGLFFIPVIIFFALMLFDNFFGRTKFFSKRSIFTTIIFFGAMVVLNVFGGA